MKPIQDLIEEIVGTCMSYPDLSEYSSEDLDILDDQIFECTRCGWWCHMHDLSICEEDLVCLDCYGEDE